MPTWLIIGASRGIGLEFARQLLSRGEQVIATVRDPEKAAELWSLSSAVPMDACRLLLCDVSSDELTTVSLSIQSCTMPSNLRQTFVNELSRFRGLQRIDYVVMNAGILRYPNVCGSTCSRLCLNGTPNLDGLQRATEVYVLWDQPINAGN